MVMQPIGTTGRIGGAGEPVHHPSNAGIAVEVPPGEDRASGVRQDDFAPGGHLPEFRPLRRYKEVTERYIVVRVFILGSCFWNYGKFSASEQSGGNAKMSSSSLAAITALKKLVNHPDLIHEHCRDKKEGFENALQHYPQVICDSSAYA